jgi:hypothetical protein
VTLIARIPPLAAIVHVAAPSTPPPPTISIIGVPPRLPPPSKMLIPEIVPFGATRTTDLMLLSTIGDPGFV